MKGDLRITTDSAGHAKITVDGVEWRGIAALSVTMLPGELPRVVLELTPTSLHFAGLADITAQEARER